MTAKLNGQGTPNRERKIAADLRGNTVSVRLTDDEYRLVEQHRTYLKMSRGSFVRLAMLHRLPTSGGSLNRSAWKRLAHASEGLLRLADWVDSLEASHADVVAREVATLAALFREVQRRVRGP